jgi:hypothetical protein
LNIYKYIGPVGVDIMMLSHSHPSINSTAVDSDSRGAVSFPVDAPASHSSSKPSVASHSSSKQHVTQPLSKGRTRHIDQADRLAVDMINMGWTMHIGPLPRRRAAIAGTKARQRTTADGNKLRKCLRKDMGTSEDAVTKAGKPRLEYYGLVKHDKCTKPTKKRMRTDLVRDVVEAPSGEDT